MKNNQQNLRHKTPQEILNLFKEKKLPENFCIIPFVNLIFNPGGKISVCRQKGTSHIVGDLEKNTIEEIWNNEYLQKWRNEFLNGNVEICKREVSEDFCHLGSSNYEYFDEVKLEPIQELPMKKFTANFNGKCNLECVMCDVWKMPNGYYDQNEFWEKAKVDFFPYIKEIELLSGEPFVQKDTWRLIDEVSSVNPDCLWSFTTNSHWKLNSNIKEKLGKITVKNIHVSIDSLDEKTYGEIRLKGKLDTVIQNLEDLVEYEKERVQNNKSPLGIALHFLIMQQNYKELKEVIDFTNKLGIRLIFDLLKVPAQFSLLSYENNDREDIIKYYLNNLSKEEIKRSMQIIMPLIHSMNTELKKKYLLTLGALNAG